MGGTEGNLKIGREKFCWGRLCGRLMSLAQETQSMREIRLLRGRLPRKGGGLTGMHTVSKCNIKSTKVKDILKHAEAISSKHKITKQH